jgi:hypothetical protein
MRSGSTLVPGAWRAGHRIRRTGLAGLTGPAGLTLMELLFTMAIGVTLTAVAVPLTGRTLDEIRAASAARYVAGRIMRIRMEAVRRSTAIALRFEPAGDDYAFAPFEDGNGNGVRTLEIHAGIDRQVGPYERLGHGFSGIRFVLQEGVPDADGVRGSSVDGVRIGTPRLLTVSPDGTATSGSLYVSGPGGQYAIRVLGATGRTRVLFYNPGDGSWHAR